MPKPIKNSKLALIGLIIPFALSLVMAGGRIPKIEPVETSTQSISDVEIKLLSQRFPELGLRKGGVIKIRNEILINNFPNASFYKTWDRGGRPPFPYLVTIIGNKYYKSLSYFNYLLFANNLEVNNNNIIELAKAFVILAIVNEPTIDTKTGEPAGLLTFPQVTFLEGKRIKEERMIGKKKNVTYTAQLKVKVDDEIRNWYLPQDIYEKKQFGGATVTDKDGKVIKIYQLPIIESNQKRGELDLNPEIEIETGTADSNAYVEWETPILPHYYLIVASNGQGTNNKVKFNLTGFDTLAPNVYIRVRDSILNQNIALMHIEIDSSGAGDTIWNPGTASTGIYWVTAGYIENDVYQPATSKKELTLEKVVTGTFNNDTTYKIYFCHQFFSNHQQGQSHAPTFASYVEDAAIESWQKQVYDWQLGSPPDTDNVHQYFINDNIHWFHNPAVTWSPFGPDRKICIQYNIKNRSSIDENYSNEFIRVKVAVAHEFYHGIQRGLSSKTFENDSFNWFTEGQARFIQSAQYPEEEFKGNLYLLRQYPWDANNYLTQLLNSSLITISLANYGYPYCIYWRFLYERFDSLGTTAEKLSVIRDAYEQTKNVESNPICEGAEAINLAFAEARQHRGTVPFDSFSQSIDRFATDCYLKKFDSASFYRKPAAVLYEFSKIKEDSTDTIVKRNSIPSFAINYYDFKTNSQAGNRVGKVKFSCIADNESLRLSSKLLLFKNTYVNNCSIIDFIQDTIIKDCGIIWGHFPYFEL